MIIITHIYTTYCKKSYINNKTSIKDLFEN